MCRKQHISKRVPSSSMEPKERTGHESILSYSPVVVRSSGIGYSNANAKASRGLAVVLGSARQRIAPMNRSSASM